MTDVDKVLHIYRKKDATMRHTQDTNPKKTFLAPKPFGIVEEIGVLRVNRVNFSGSAHM